MTIIRKSQSDIREMSLAGRIAADALNVLRENLVPGISMAELDAIAEAFLEQRGAVATSKGYKGFPSALCTSPNSMVVHGIPTNYQARSGDIVSLDLGVTLDGFIADTAATYGVGTISESAARLLVTCERALAAGISQARIGNDVSDISNAIQTVTEEAGFSVVRSLVGHGVGHSYHEDPQVPNFRSSHSGPPLVEGMTLAIEPMITAGSHEVWIHDDGWSISTCDGSLSAHFEHTVAITRTGPVILTAPSPKD
jgi:methionyl aminopeptidase